MRLCWRKEVIEGRIEALKDSAFAILSEPCFQKTWALSTVPTTRLGSTPMDANSEARSPIKCLLF